MNGSLAITPAATTVTLISSQQPAIVGQSVTFTATVSPAAAGTPTGNIAFNDGSTMIASAALSSGHAAFTTTSLAVGSHSLTAAYGADLNFSQSTSAALTQQVEYNICALYDQTKSVNSGAVVPIKLQLCDIAGKDLSASQIVLHASGLSSTSGYSGPAQTVGNANPDSDFRFDSSLGPVGGYVFNLSTKGLSAGTYSLQFKATGDPVVHSVSFGVR